LNGLRHSLLDVNNSDIEFDQYLIKYQKFSFALKKINCG